MACRLATRSRKCCVVFCPELPLGMARLPDRRLRLLPRQIRLVDHAGVGLSLMELLCERRVRGRMDVVGQLTTKGVARRAMGS
jgi:hypothetical protein